MDSNYNNYNSVIKYTERRWKKKSIMKITALSSEQTEWVVNMNNIVISNNRMTCVVVVVVSTGVDDDDYVFDFRFEHVAPNIIIIISYT